MMRTKRATLLLVFCAAITSSLYSETKELGRTVPPAEQAATSSTQTAVPNLQFFNTNVRPISLKNRAEHARCYGCNILPGGFFHREPLSPGSTDWTDAQSQRN